MDRSSGLFETCSLLPFDPMVEPDFFHISARKVAHAPAFFYISPEIRERAQTTL